MSFYYIDAGGVMRTHETEVVPSIVFEGMFRFFAFHETALPLRSALGGH